MTDEYIIKTYYRPLMAKINSVEARVNELIKLLNDERQAETSENDAAIVELAELVSEMEGE